MSKTLSSKSAEVSRVILLILILNLAVALAKAIYGAWSGSLAVSADAVHSFTDALSNVLGLVAVRWARKPPNERHPYGYRKVEILAALAVGVLIAFGGLELGRAALRGLMQSREPPKVTNEGLLVLAATLVVNLAVATYEARRGRALKSPFLLADASHTASDVLVTVAVLGSQFASRYGWHWADPVVALGLFAFIGHIAWGILRPSFSTLLDRAVVDDVRIKAIVTSVEGAEDCHRIRSRGVEGAVHVDLHLLVDGRLSVSKAHDIAHRVEERLKQEFPEVIDITIHVEPAGDPWEGL